MAISSRESCTNSVVRSVWIVGHICVENQGFAGPDGLAIHRVCLAVANHEHVESIPDRRAKKGVVRTFRPYLSGRAGPGQTAYNPNRNRAGEPGEHIDES